VVLQCACGAASSESLLSCGSNMYVHCEVLASVNAQFYGGCHNSAFAISAVTAVCSLFLPLRWGAGSMALMLWLNLVI
jgi:hypothetical protein